jgi:hypothetical protein
MRLTSGMESDCARVARVLWCGVWIVAMFAGCSHATASRSRSGSTRTQAKAAADDDSVFIGYDTRSRQFETRAVGSLVLSDDARRPQVNWIEDLLEGRAAGVTVDRSARDSPFTYAAWAAPSAVSRSSWSTASRGPPPCR